MFLRRKIQLALLCLCPAFTGCATSGTTIARSDKQDLLRAKEFQFSRLNWAVALDQVCQYLDAEQRDFIDDQIRERRSWLEANNSKLFEREAHAGSDGMDGMLRSIADAGCQEAETEYAERAVKAAGMSVPPLLARFDEVLAENIVWSAALSGVAPIWEVVGKGDKGAYRFSWDRSFHPHVIITVIWHSDGSADATTKVEGLDWESNKIIDEEHIRNLAPEQTAKFVNLYDDSFWKALPVAKEETKCTFLDGASWSFEGYDSGHYQYVSRANPDYRGQCAPKDNSFFYSLGISFIEASGLQFDAIY